VTLAGGKDERLVEQGTTNVEAYQLYLKGHALLGRRGASIPGALDLFRKAVEIDPGYSLAWAGVADACTGLAITGSVSGSASKPQAMAAARRSIELDPRSAAGHTALAVASLLFENNRDMAGREFERALELRPRTRSRLSRAGRSVFRWERLDDSRRRSPRSRPLQGCRGATRARSAAWPWSSGNVAGGPRPARYTAN
jgi:tetratricopeptide (TPR) repeat protein